MVETYLLILCCIGVTALCAAFVAVAIDIVRSVWKDFHK